MIEHILEHKSWSWFIISQPPQKPWCTVCGGWGSPWGRLVPFVFLKVEFKMSDFFKEDINTVVNEIGQVFNLFLIIQKYDRILWKSISSLPEGDQNCFSSQGGQNYLCFAPVTVSSTIYVFSNYGGHNQLCHSFAVYGVWTQLFAFHFITQNCPQIAISFFQRRQSTERVPLVVNTS